MEKNIKEIVLAGGCFWGTQEYIRQLPGVLETYVGYANSNKLNPSYEEVCTGNTGAAEAVYVKYNSEIIDLNHLLKYFFKTIDPTSKNRQGNDIGSQYRSGIYYTDKADLKSIEEFIKKEQENYKKPIVTEVLELFNMSRAEDYHQNYLVKNPNGYCHVKFDTLPKKGEILTDKLFDYKNRDDESLKKELSEISYKVVRQSATERPFTSDLNGENRDGIYVDITNGQPLFSSKDKFDAGCGWPSFTKPINQKLVKEKADNSYGMRRVEIRTSLSDSHLGHVFNDGPKDRGGLRYCMNGAALKFIPVEDMKKEGYGYLLYLFDK